MSDKSLANTVENYATKVAENGAVGVAHTKALLAAAGTAGRAANTRSERSAVRQSLEDGEVRWRLAEFVE